MTEQQKTPTQQTTEYMILKWRKGEPGEGAGERLHQWDEVGRVAAHTPQAAIKAKAGKSEGTFVAVPARSWKPLTRKIEKVEKDVWS